MNQIINARKSIFDYDLIRAIVYCLVICTIIYFFTKEKLSKNIAFIILVGLMLSDLIGVSRRYIDRDLFVSPRQIKNLFVPKKETISFKKIPAVLGYMNQDSNYPEPEPHFFIML